MKTEDCQSICIISAFAAYDPKFWAIVRGDAIAKVIFKGKAKSTIQLKLFARRKFFKDLSQL
jgi:hypothetical protein